MSVVYSGDATYASGSYPISLNILNDSLTTSYSTAATTGQSYTISAAINSTLVGGAADRHAVAGRGLENAGQRQRGHRQAEQQR